MLTSADEAYKLRRAHPARVRVQSGMRAVVLTFRGVTGAVGAAVLALMTACQTTTAPTPPTTPPVAAPASPPPVTGAEPAAPILPPSTPLAAEARWLGDLFAGTPVQVVGERDGSVRLQVPMKFAFDAGAKPPAAATAPKPPLQAVLDKLSQSLKRQPAARLQAASPGPSSAERLVAIRSHLAAKGVANWRVAQAGVPAEGQVVLRLVPAPTGLRQLDDNSLPPTSAGRPPAPAGGSSKASP